MGAVAKHTVRAGLVGAAVTLTAAFGTPGHAIADPAVTPTSPSTPETSTSPEATPESTSPDSTTSPGSTTSPNPTAPGTGTAPQSGTAQSGETPTLSGIPGDAELAELLRMLKQSGAIESGVEALKSILYTDGQLDPSALLSKLGFGSEEGAPGTTPSTPEGTTPESGTPQGTTPQGTTPEAGTPEAGTADSGTTMPGSTPVADETTVPTADGVLGTLQKLTGTQMLSPAMAPFCTEPTADNPLGLVTAPAVAIPGPWPTAEGTPLAEILKGTGNEKLLDLADEEDTAPITEVKKGETAYALVPGENPDSDQLRVAWFNTSSLKGGFIDLKPISEDENAGPLLTALAQNDQFDGVRLARAQTGEGTVLSAVFGSTTTDGRTCYFLPALGTVEN